MAKSEKNLKDTEKKTKKTTKSTNKSKNKNNYDPKWKAKKEGTTKKVVTKKSTKKTPSKKENNKDNKAKEVVVEEIEFLDELEEAKEQNVKEEVKTEVVEEVELLDEEEPIRVIELTKEDKKKIKEENAKEEKVEESKKEKVEDKKEDVKENNENVSEKFNLPSKEELDELYKNVEVAEKKDDVIINPEVKKNKHYNYLARVCTLVALILLFFVIGLTSLLSAFNYELGASTSYSEYTSNDYSVCNNDDCVGKDSIYQKDNVTTIRSTFNYEALYSKKTKYNTKYKVLATLNIYEDNESKKVRYTKDDILLDSTEFKSTGEVISFSTDVEVDYLSYKNFVNDYFNQTGVTSNVDLEVSLYLEEGKVSREISYITIPLNSDSFQITSNNLDNQNQVVIFNVKNTEIDPLFLFVSIICFFMIILLLVYLINFIRMVKNLDNKYNSKLKDILKEYDDIIVTVKKEYKLSDNTKLIKVESFDEILDARNSLEKPIVYERVNNVKSKFYVEDNNNTVYVYTMKDDGE